MATKNREVELGITVTTAGSEGVRRLKDEVDALAKGGGDAAPKFQALSDELGRLGDQARALEAFDQISRDIDALSLAQNSAAVETQKLSTELNEAVVAADRFRAAEQSTRTELVQSQNALTEARIKLAEYKNENKNSIGTTEQYRGTVRKLTADIIELRRQIAEKSQSLRESKRATSEAEVAEERLESAYSRSAKQAQQAGAALTERERAQQDALGSLRSLGVETENLTQSEIGLVNALVDVREEIDRTAQSQRDAAEAARLQQQEAERLAAAEKAAADEYSRWWQQALYEREQAEQSLTAAQRAAADEAKRSGQAIRDALGTVGVRTAEELRLEIQRVKDAMDLLKTSGTLAGRELDTAMAVGQRRINALERDIREVTGTLTIMDRASKLLNNTFVQFAGAYTVVEVVQRMGAAFFTATKQIEGLRLGLGQVYGSTQVAQTQIDFLRRTADSAGISFGSISDAFVRFSASTKAANMPLSETNALFESVTRAAGTLGLSGDKVNHILDALSQIAAKGVVSMEELRQQLGDSLPGALSLAAQGLGLTDAQLIKLVESGGLLARDLFPALTKALGSMQGEVNTTSAAWERFKNFVTTTFQTIGDAGVIDILKGAIYGLGLALGPVVIGFNALIEAITTAIRSAAAFAATLASGGGLKAALAAVQTEIEASIARQTQLALAYRKLIGATDETTSATQQQTQAVVELTAEQQQVVATIQAQTAATVSQGVATEAASQKAQLAGLNWNQLRIQLEELNKTQENQIQVSEKTAKAKEIEGRNAVATAKIIGDENQVRVESTQAAFNNASALEAVSRVREQALAQQIAYRDALLDEIARLGDADGARLKSLQTINQRIQVMGAEAERARQSAAESRNNALAMDLESAKIADNSSRLAELTRARGETAIALASLQQLEQQGINVAEAKSKLTAEQTRIEALYRDALLDTAAAAERKIATLRSEAELVMAKLSLEKAALEAEKASAIARGDTARVVQINLQLKETEIKIARAKVEATAAEAKATLAAVEADRAALLATGQLTDAKKAELDARIAAAKVKQLESQAGAERIKILEQELNNLRLYGDEALNAGQKFSELSRQLYGTADAYGALGEAAGLATQQLDASGRAIAKGRVGNTGPVDNSGMFLAREKLESGTLTTDDAALVQGTVAAAKANYEMMQRNPSAFSYDGQRSVTEWLNIARRLEETMSAMQAAEERKQETSGGATTPQATTTYTPPVQAMQQVVQNPTRIIRIDLNGTKTNIGVASEADADALQTILQQLANAKGVVL